MILTYNFCQFYEFYKKKLILPQKGGSGVPYLKKSPQKFDDIYIKFMHLGSLFIWNCQNSWN